MLGQTHLPMKAAEGRRSGLADTDRLVAALHSQMAFSGGPADEMFTVDQLLALSRRLPGHFMEAAVAGCLADAGWEGRRRPG